MLIVLASTTPARTADFGEAWQGTRWGESGAALTALFGPRAIMLPRPINFGDSVAQIVRRDIVLGGLPLIAFYQMDKATGGLKRIQLERQRHGVNPTAFRAVLSGLQAVFGPPDLMCGLWPQPASGFQAAAERIWRRDGTVIRAIFRDTTIEAFEGCFAGDPAAGACGLTGQLLVRISPPDGDTAGCPAMPRP